MGYTHYFQQGREVTDKEWGGIMADAACILQAAQDSGILLQRGYDDSRKPKVSLDVIQFNGFGDNGHEDFYLPRVMGPAHRFNFCKTARKPYDVAVAAIMLSMHHHAPGAWDLGSDGELNEREWIRAMDLYHGATGREATDVEFLLR